MFKVVRELHCEPDTQAKLAKFSNLEVGFLSKKSLIMHFFVVI